MSESDSRDGMRNVYSLGLVSLFTDISTEMVMGYLPVFAVQELGASRAFLGLIEGVGELANYLLRIVSGFFSDRLGKRKPLVLAGYTLSAASKPVFAFARVPTDVLVVRAADRSGKGLRTAPRDALISQSVKESTMGRAFGIHRTLDQTGAIAGPLLATLLLPLVGPRTLFLLSFIPALVALLILWLLVTDVRTQPRGGSLLRGARSLLRGDFPLLLLAFGLFGLGFYDFSFVLVRSSELGVAAELVPLVYLGLNLFHSMVGYPIGILSDRIGRESLLAFSFLLFSASSLAMAYASGLPAVALLIVLYGLFFGMLETLYRAVIPRFAPSELRGTAYGLFYLVYGLATLLGMTLVGYLWDSYGRFTAFEYSALVGLASFALMSFLALKVKRRGL